MGAVWLTDMDVPSVKAGRARVWCCRRLAWNPGQGQQRPSGINALDERADMRYDSRMSLLIHITRISGPAA
jgi:hypothetical protein